MEKRQLGNSELYTAPLVFGSNVLGWTVDEKQAFAILDAFVAAGFNMIDTADIYVRWATGQGGESETIIGKWLRQRNNRNQVILATKVGMDMGAGRSGLSKKYILQAVNDSLKRLGRVSAKRPFQPAEFVVANAAYIVENKVVRLVTAEHLRKHVLHGPPVAIHSTENTSAH